MPLERFVAKTIAVLGTDADEVLVDCVILNEPMPGIEALPLPAEQNQDFDGPHL